MAPIRWLAVSILVVAVIGAGALAPAILGGAAAPGATGTVATSCSTNAVSGATASTGTATTQSSGTSTVPPGTQALSFTYSPASPVTIDSVEYAGSVGSDGSTHVTFYVTYTNNGTSDIYTVVGCGSSLTASFQPGNGVIEKVSGGPVCLCDEAMTPLAPGQDRMATTPGCWSGYGFVLTGHGTVQVDFALYWGSSQASPNQTFTDITAQFAFA